MDLKQQIQAELKRALQKKDIFVCGLLRFLNAAVQNREIAKRAKLAKTEPLEKLKELSQLTDEEALEVIVSEIKKRKDAITEFTKGNRADLASREKQEMEYLQRYLPIQLTEEELKKIVQEAIARINASSVKDIGRVMAEITPQIKGRAEGAVASNMVKELLSLPSQQND